MIVGVRVADLRDGIITRSPRLHLTRDRDKKGRREMARIFHSAASRENREDRFDFSSLPFRLLLLYVSFFSFLFFSSGRFDFRDSANESI